MAPEIFPAETVPVNAAVEPLSAPETLTVELNVAAPSTIAVPPIEVFELKSAVVPLNVPPINSDARIVGTETLVLTAVALTI